MALRPSRLALCAVLAGLPLVMAGQARAAPEPWKAKAREIYAHAISLRTVKGYGKVPELAQYLADQFKAAGFPAEDIHILPHEETAALVVRWRAPAKSRLKPIVLLAHMDVVEADPKDWPRDPFRLVEEDGYFYGRGTSDDKQGVAALTTTFLRLRAEGFEPARDLVIAFSGDEETGMKTTEMLAQHPDVAGAEFALNADAGGGAVTPDRKPLGFAFQAGEKTYATYRIVATNPGGHSSLPRPDNAIYDLAGALVKLAAYRFPPKANDITIASLRESAKLHTGEAAEARRRFADNPADVEAADIISKDPGEIGMVRTTCVATMAQAGHAENALPQSASATVNCRIFPGTEPDEVRATLAGIVGDTIKVEPVQVQGSAPASPLRPDVLGAYTRAIHARFPNAPVIPVQAPYATDGRVFRAAGIPTYGVEGTWGVAGVDDRAHGLNERLPVDAFYGNLDHWDFMIRALAGPARAGRRR